jgi:hypothetical protein
VSSAVKAVLTVAVLALVFLRVDAGIVAATFLRLKPWPLVQAFVWVAVAIVVSALKWGRILSRRGHPASLLELTRNGTRPLRLPGGAERTFLEDDDEVILTGFAQAKDYRVGFGEVRGKIVAARST